MEHAQSTPLRTRSVYTTALLFLSTAILFTLFHPSTIGYIISNQELPPLPWGACCAYAGPVSEFLGLEAVVALLYLDLLIIAPLSVLTAFLIWKNRKIGGHLGIYLTLVRTGILLIGFAVPGAIILFIQLVLLRRIWTNLR